MSTHVAKAGLGLVTLLHGLVRGKTIQEAQEEANTVVAVASPILDELGPRLEAMRQAKEERQQRQARQPCARSSLCVLGADHPGVYCQDQHGTLFQEDSRP